VLKTVVLSPNVIQASSNAGTTIFLDNPTILSINKLLLFNQPPLATSGQVRFPEYEPFGVLNNQPAEGTEKN